MTLSSVKTNKRGLCYYVSLHKRIPGFRLFQNFAQVAESRHKLWKPLRFHLCHSSHVHLVRLKYFLHKVQMRLMPGKCLWRKHFKTTIALYFEGHYFLRANYLDLIEKTVPGKGSNPGSVSWGLMQNEWKLAAPFCQLYSLLSHNLALLYHEIWIRVRYLLIWCVSKSVAIYTKNVIIFISILNLIWVSFIF